MNFKDPKIWTIALGAGIVASVMALPQARGELVYENGVAVEAGADRVEDRSQLRQVLNSSEKAQTTIATEQRQAVPVIQQAPAQAPAQYSAFDSAPAQEQSYAVELQNLSKTELMRRERVRAELRNEDVLQERLEELRLRDERKRTDQLLGKASGETQSPIMEEVVLGQAAADRQAASAATGGQQVAVLNAYGQMEQGLAAPAQSIATISPAEAEETRFVISTRGGLSEMNGTTGYEIRPRYSAGVGVGVVASENITFEVGYTYNEFGVLLASTNPYVATVQNWANSYGYNPNFETVAQKQNVVDAGLKIHFLGESARLRPFMGGGAAYSKSFINYDDRILDELTRQGFGSLGSDYEVNSFLGYLSTGLDVRVAKNVTVGGLFKYYTVLSARENRSVNNAALYGGYLSGPMPYGNFYAALPDQDKQIVGGTLSKSSFYTIQGNVSFSF